MGEGRRKGEGTEWQRVGRGEGLGQRGGRQEQMSVHMLAPLLAHWLGTHFPPWVSDWACQPSAAATSEQGVQNFQNVRGVGRSPGFWRRLWALGSGIWEVYAQLPSGPERLRSGRSQGQGCVLGSNEPALCPTKGSSPVNSWTLTVIQPGHSG